MKYQYNMFVLICILLLDNSLFIYINYIKLDYYKIEDILLINYNITFKYIFIVVNMTSCSISYKIVLYFTSSF